MEYARYIFNTYIFNTKQLNTNNQDENHIDFKKIKEETYSKNFIEILNKNKTIDFNEFDAQLTSIIKKSMFYKQ